MSRQRRRFGGANPFLDRLSVLKGHKIHIKRVLENSVPWLSDERDSLECLAMLGPRVGVQVTPEWGELADNRRAILDQLKETRPEIDEAGTAEVALKGFLTESWSLAIVKEEGRFTITIPEEVRAIGHLPHRGGEVYVYGDGGVLVIAEAAEWIQHQRRVSGDIRELLQATLLKR